MRRATLEYWSKEEAKLLLRNLVRPAKFKELNGDKYSSFKEDMMVLLYGKLRNFSQFWDLLQTFFYLLGKQKILHSFNPLIWDIKYSKAKDA